MSQALVPVITRAGLAAVIRAQGDGLQAEIVSMAVGLGRSVLGKSVGYLPSKDATGLAQEVLRVPLLSGARVGDAGFRVLARVPASSAPAEYVIREVGFFLATGELLVLWSDPTLLLASKTTLSDVDLSFDLQLEQLPLSALTIVVEAPDIPDTSGVLAYQIAASANLFIAALDAEGRLAASKL
jgi:hypothetical protein